MQCSESRLRGLENKSYEERSTRLEYGSRLGATCVVNDSSGTFADSLMELLLDIS